jgi:tetratricopeptide (TPR) repeat protein
VDAVKILRAYSTAMISRLYTESGDLMRAEEYLHLAHANLRPKDLSTFGPMMVALAQGEFDMARGDFRRVTEEMRSLLNRLEPTGVQIFVADAQFLEGKALLALGELDSAEQLLTAACETSERLGIHRLDWAIHAELALLYQRLGNADLEYQHVRAGRAGVEYLARRSPPELVESFYNLSIVRRLMEHPEHE